MATKIISKRCSGCKQINPISEFHKAKASKDGHHSYCKICNREYGRKYEKTEKYKVARKIYEQSKKYKIGRKRYRQSEEGKIAHRKACLHYNRTEKGKINQRRCQKKYSKTEKGKARLQNRDPERIKAIHAVNNAIRDKRLNPPTQFTCFYCPEQAMIYHHPNGYSQEHRFDIVPVCRKCHWLVHKKLAS